MRNAINLMLLLLLLAYEIELNISKSKRATKESTKEVILSMQSKYWKEFYFISTSRSCEITNHRKRYRAISCNVNSHLVIRFRCVTIISDGSKALSGSQDKSFRVWDLDTSAYLKQERSRGHPEDIIDITVTNDGSRCVSSSMDGTFKIWKCETAEECFTLKGSRNELLLVI